MNAIKTREKITKNCQRCGKIFGVYPEEVNTVHICSVCFNGLRAVMEENKMAIPLTADTDSQKRIVEITEGMKDLLLYKNKKYGDSALKPKHRFYKGDSTNSILIRLDDKIGRIESNTDELPRVNDVADLIGYLTLLLISMGVTKEDLQKFMD